MKPLLPPVFLFFPFILWTQTIDSSAIRQVDSLIQVSRALTGQGDFQQALEVNAEAEKIALEKLSGESAAYASCCHNRGRVIYFTGNYPETEKWFLEAKNIREKTLGKEHPEYANSIQALAILYQKTGQYEKVEPLYLEAKAIREETLGKDHPDYAASLDALADLYKRMGQYEKAEPLYLEALSIREKALGKEHSDYAASLNNLAGFYGTLGQYEKTEPLLLEALVVYGKALGKDDPRYSKGLNNLASLYKTLGQYEKAEPLYLEALAIREEALGKDHSEYAISLNNLAGLYKEMGQYEKAEPRYLDALAIREKVLGREHPDFSASLNNLAGLYKVLGQYEKAEPLYLEAMAIREAALGREHPDFSASLNNLANLYLALRQYEKAEPLYLEALAIREKALGKEHADYAESLNNLAELYLEMGRYEKAESLFLESKATWEKTLGKEHPLYAASLNNLGALYKAMGQYEKAKSLLLESKAILEKALGKEHQSYAQSLIDLAALYKTMGQYEKALPLFVELSSVSKTLMGNASRYLSEQELNSYLDQFSGFQDQTLSFVQRAAGDMLSPTGYDNSLFYKGFLLNASDQMKRLALSDPTATELFNRLKGYHRSLATQYTLPVPERDSAKVAELETKANELEKELTRMVAGYGAAIRQVQWQEVQAALQPGEAAVEFVHYRYYDQKETDSTMYAAMVLRPEMERPQFIPLFEERQLDGLLQTHGERRGDYVNALYTLKNRGLQPLEGPKKTLYELIWKPLEKETAPVKTIYFSPSGFLHRLNFGAIPIDEEETLADRYNLVRLNSTRQLVIPVRVEVAANDAILYGGVEFDVDSTALATAYQHVPSNSMTTRGGGSFSYSDTLSRGGTWDYLKWTEDEVDKVQTTLVAAGFQTDTRKSYAATEGSFKSISHGSPSPRVLHLATHGFFFPDAARRSVSEDDPVFTISDHPMIRSGLILAGGNYAWQTGKPLQPGMEDGILTAYEISQADLSNTELVVLSACETGLGDIQGNEGVYGLQRAFKIAGAKYLIMSLWQVEDRQTMVFMEAFYQHWLEEEMTIPAAFRATQLDMRDRFFDPYLWAGFVLVE